MRWELHVWAARERVFAHWWDLPAALGWANRAIATAEPRERVWALANWSLAANLDPYARVFRAPRVASVSTAPPSIARRVSDPTLFVRARRRVHPKRFGLFVLRDWPETDEQVPLLNLFNGSEDSTWEVEQRMPRILRALGVTFGADLFDWIKGGELGRSITIPNSAVRLSVSWQPVVFSGYYNVSWAVSEPTEAALAASAAFDATVTQPYGADVRVTRACSPTMGESEYYIREVSDFARAPHAFVAELYEAIVEKNAETLKALLPSDRTGGAAEAAAASRDLAARFAGLAVDRVNALRREGTLRTAQSVIDVGRGLASVAGPVGAGIGAAVGGLAELVVRAAVATGGAADLSEEETMRIFSSLHFLPHSGSVRGARSYHRAPSQVFAPPPTRGTYTPPARLLRLDENERPVLEQVQRPITEVGGAARRERTGGSGSSLPMWLVAGGLTVGALAMAAKTR